MTEYTQEQKNELSDKILMYLDGWEAVGSLNDNEPTQEEISDETEIDVDELYSDEKINKLFDHVNKRIVLSFLLKHYESSLNQALSITKQKKIEKIEKLDLEDQNMFYQAVYKLTASNLWKLYNTRPNSNEEEADWKDSYSGVLYIQAMRELKPFEIQFNSAATYILDE